MAEVLSKTAELRHYLRRKTRELERDIKILKAATEAYDARDKIPPFALEMCSRYNCLTSDELQIKALDDRRKLELCQRNIEYLKSVSELNIDIDAIEKTLKVDISVNAQTTLLWDLQSPRCPTAKKSFRFQLDERILYVSFCTLLADRYIVSDRVCFRGIAEIQVGPYYVIFFTKIGEAIRLEGGGLDFGYR